MGIVCFVAVGSVGDTKLALNGPNEGAFGQHQDVNPVCTCPRWNRERPSAAAETKVMTGQFSDHFH